MPQMTHFEKLLFFTEAILKLFLAFFLVFQWSVNYTFFRYNMKPGK